MNIEKLIEAREILSEEINKDIQKKRTVAFSNLCYAAGNLDVAIQRLKKDDRGEKQKNRKY